MCLSVFLSLTLSQSPGGARLCCGGSVTVKTDARQPHTLLLSPCLYARVCLHHWRACPPLNTGTDTHSELIDPIPLSGKTFPLTRLYLNTLLLTQSLPLSQLLYFPYWYLSFSFYLYSSSSSFSSHSASFLRLFSPPLPSRASWTGQLTSSNYLSVQDPDCVFCIHSVQIRAVHSLLRFCDVEAVSWPLRSWPSGSKVGGDLLLTSLCGLSLCFPSSYQSTSCYTGNGTVDPASKMPLDLVTSCRTFFNKIVYLKCTNTSGIITIFSHGPAQSNCFSC